MCVHNNSVKTRVRVAAGTWLLSVVQRGVCGLLLDGSPCPAVAVES